MIGGGGIGIRRRYRGVSLQSGVIEGTMRRLLFGTLRPGSQNPVAGVVIIVVWLLILSGPGRVISRRGSSVIGCLRVRRIDVQDSGLLGLRHPWRGLIKILMRILVERLVRGIDLPRIYRRRRRTVSVPVNDRLKFLLSGLGCWRSSLMHS